MTTLFVLGAVACALAGYLIGTLSSKSSLKASESVMRASVAVSTMANHTFGQASREWDAAERLRKLEDQTQSMSQRLESALTILDRMDVTLGKVADYTILQSRRKAGTAREILTGPPNLPQLGSLWGSEQTGR